MARSENICSHPCVLGPGSARVGRQWLALELVGLGSPSASLAAGPFINIPPLRLSPFFFELLCRPRCALKVALRTHCQPASAAPATSVGIRTLVGARATRRLMPVFQDITGIIGAAWQ